MPRHVRPAARNPSPRGRRATVGAFPRADARRGVSDTAALQRNQNDRPRSSSRRCTINPRSAVRRITAVRTSARADEAPPGSAGSPITTLPPIPSQTQPRPASVSARNHPAPSCGTARARTAPTWAAQRPTRSLVVAKGCTEGVSATDHGRQPPPTLLPGPSFGRKVPEMPLDQGTAPGQWWSPCRRSARRDCSPDRWRLRTTASPVCGPGDRAVIPPRRATTTSADRFSRATLAPVRRPGSSAGTDRGARHAHRCSFGPDDAPFSPHCSPRRTIGSDSSDTMGRHSSGDSARSARHATVPRSAARRPWSSFARVDSHRPASCDPTLPLPMVLFPRGWRRSLARPRLQLQGTAPRDGPVSGQRTWTSAPPGTRRSKEDHLAAHAPRTEKGVARGHGREECCAGASR